jgi:hypothetical protein
MLSPEQVAEIFEDPQNPNPFACKRLLNLYIIRPEEELPGEALEFSLIIMAQMMELGVKAAERALDEGPIRF